MGWVDAERLAVREEVEGSAFMPSRRPFVQLGVALLKLQLYMASKTTIDVT